MLQLSMDVHVEQHDPLMAVEEEEDGFLHYLRHPFVLGPSRWL